VFHFGELGFVGIKTTTPPWQRDWVMLSGKVVVVCTSEDYTKTLLTFRLGTLTNNNWFTAFRNVSSKQRHA